MSDIAEITRIKRNLLERYDIGESEMYTVREMLASVSVATRMSWAAHRQTIRDEDTAYCLLGLFDVNMPLLYGEGGEKAFLRLQREIVQQIPSDHSILAWGRGMSGSVRNKTSILSPSPRWFAHIEDLSVVPRPKRFHDNDPWQQLHPVGSFAWTLRRSRY